MIFFRPLNASDLSDYHWTVTTLVLQQEIDAAVDVTVVCPSSPSLVSPMFHFPFLLFYFVNTPIKSAILLLNAYKYELFTAFIYHALINVYQIPPIVFCFRLYYQLFKECVHVTMAITVRPAGVNVQAVAAALAMVKEAVTQ